MIPWLNLVLELIENWTRFGIGKTRNGLGS